MRRENLIAMCLFSETSQKHHALATHTVAITLESNRHFPWHLSSNGEGEPFTAWRQCQRLIRIRSRKELLHCFIQGRTSLRLSSIIFIYNQSDDIVKGFLRLMSCNNVYYITWLNVVSKVTLQQQCSIPSHFVVIDE